MGDDVAPEQLLIGRGSDEGIDLLVRAFCVPGSDAVLVTPPVFGMYAVSARLQGARVVDVPLQDATDDFRVDLQQVAARAEGEGAKLVFLCSPGNPAGGVIPRDAVLRLAQRLQGRALVVVDEAYIEFADAHVIALLQRCQAPYPVPAPCAALALGALQPASLAQTRDHVETIRQERGRLGTALAALPAVHRVSPAPGNFLLVRFFDAEAAFRALLAAGVVVRDQRAAPQLGDALRISIGTPEENDRMIAALRVAGAPLRHDFVSGEAMSRPSGTPAGEAA